MKLLNPRMLMISLTSAALCGVLSAGPAGAADSACKGMEQAKCVATDGCGWTNEYTRKDGKTVAGYCRKIGKPDAAAGKEKTPAQTPAAKPTGTAKPPAPTATPAPAPAPAPAAKPTATGPTPTGAGSAKPPAGTATGAGQMSMPMPK